MTSAAPRKYDDRVLDLTAPVRACLSAHGVGDTATVAVACSAGPDSTALADAVVRARGPSRVELVYIDHGLRDATSRDRDAVAALAERLGCAQRAVSVGVARDVASLEGAARRARYAALDRLPHDWVLLGHTASDQAETVLMRILRGTGVAGLAGIPERRGRYLRPLLAVWRPEVEAYLRARGLGACDDAMNADHRFARNRIRHQVLPALRAENPRLDAALVQLARAAGEQRELLDRAAGRLLAGELDVAAVRGAPRGVAKRALQLAAEVHGLGPLAAPHLEAMYHLAVGQAGGSASLDLPGGRFFREYGSLRFELGGAPALEAEPDGGGRGPRVVVKGADGPYHLRHWRAGDRMRPRRLQGRSRKLSDLYTDAKVPAPQRAAAVVVVRARDGQIVWAEHVGPAHGCDIEVALTTKVAVATKD